MAIQIKIYEEMGNKYCYEGTNTLINNFDIKDINKLSIIEKDITSSLYFEFMSQDFEPQFYDFEYFCEIHKFLFQSIYNWAGNIRKVDMKKGNSQFCPVIELSRRCVLTFFDIKMTRFDNLEFTQIVNLITDYAYQINELHPFREGNGRTLRIFLTKLLNKYNYNINYDKISKELLLQADIEAMKGNITLLKDCYSKIIS